MTSRLTLDAALARSPGKFSDRDHGMIREMAFGVCRRFFELDGVLAQLLKKALKSRDADVRALLLIGLYQMRYMRVPDHAAVGETVAACRQLGKPWAGGLVNAVLRQFQKRDEELLGNLDPAQRYAHPHWLFDALEQAWPEQFRSILEANNEAPPLSLRVNIGRITRAAWMESARGAGLEPRAGTLAPEAVVMDAAVDVEALPGFAQGLVSVQDEAAQLAPGLLDCRTSQRVLDACAAPGGKSCHLLERSAGIELIALDSNAARLERVRDNLQRLQLQARVVCGDASAVAGWWDGRPFERILLDAPCSGSGVIRRHPDIKLLRTPRQIVEASAMQRRILDALWPCLAPGGILLYSTCSVLPTENEAVVDGFLAATADARELRIDASWGMARSHGRQLLPGAQDGFYYARLEKAAPPGNMTAISG
jgi:16S rRNA (cytosine967-C5)-methyltransferase